MANEQDYDWGDDFLDGDFDFDFDFDEKKDQGFLKSVSKGFFSALKSNTVGDADARVKTLRRILPKSFGTTFDFYRDLDRKKQEAFKEFKENSADLMGDLAFLSGSLSESLRDRLPNKIVDGLEEFSKKDFSDWEKPAELGESRLEMGYIEDDEQERLIEAMSQQSLMTLESTDAITKVMTSVGSKQLAAGLQTGQQLYEVNANLQRLYDYQMRIHGQREAIKLNLMTRQYLTDAKYYKFMEAAQHRMIQEIKLVAKNTGMSDFEKTSMIQATKGRLRDSLLKTTLSRSGGFGDALAGIVSKDSVNDTLGVLSSIVGDIRMGQEMTAGVGIPTGELVGSMMGQMLVEHGPKFFDTKMGREMIGKLRAKFPDQAKQFDKTMKEVKQFGDTLSYSTKALGSVMGRHYQETGMMDLPDMTYEEYVAELEDGKKPMPKLVWDGMRAAQKAAGGAFNLIGENYQESQGSIYQIKEKSLASLKDNSVWSVHDSRSVTEEIPVLLSEIHNSIEKIRTGDDSVPRMRYDYRTSRLTSVKTLNKQVERMITPTWELNSYADAAKSIVGDIDNESLLSKEASDAMAHRLAREADKGTVFNPYDYIGMMTDEYLNEDHAKEIEAVIRKRFGITNEMIDKTQEASIDGLLARLQVPTEEGKELLHELSIRTENLQRYTPDIADKIDLIRSLGMDEGLKEAGYIQLDPDTNREVFNQELIWQHLHNQITGKGIDLKLPKENIDNSVYSTRSNSLQSSSPYLSSNLTPTPSSLPAKEEVNDALSNIINNLVKIKENTANFSGMMLEHKPAEQVKLDPLLELVTTTNSTLAEMSDRQLEQLTVLRKLRAVSTVGTEGIPQNEVTEQQRTEEREKQGLLDRLRSVVPSDVFNKGVEALIANRPMVLGGLLGGLSMTAINNPKAAVLLAGGAMAATMYGKLESMANKGRQPGEDEDIYDAQGNVLLSANKKNVGDYYDQASGKVIKTWGDVKGNVIDISKGAAAIAVSAKDLAGKVFGPDGREVMLDGVHKVMSFVSKTFNAIDPVAKMRKAGEAVLGELDQLDVYKKGEKDPVLTRRGFKNEWYYDAEGNPIKGWKEIKGPVYDQDGYQLISTEDLRDGLHTIGGMSITRAQDATTAFGKLVGKGAMWLKDNGRERLGTAILGREVEGPESVGFNRYEPITERLDSIYALVAGHWGMDTKIPGVTERMSPQQEAFVSDEADDVVDGSPEPEEGVRLNSLADKIRRKKEKREMEFQESVNDIADSLAPKDKQGKRQKDGGILGALFGMAGTGAFGLLKSFLSVGISGFKTLAGLNKTLMKGLFSLGKVLSGALLGRKATDAVTDLDLDGPDRDGKDRKGKRGKRSKFGKFGKFGKMSNLSKLSMGGALLMGGDMILDGARSAMDVEEGSFTDQALNVASMGVEGAGYVATASALAGMAGTSLTGIGAAAAPFLFNPVTLGIAVAGVAGYGLYKWMSSAELTLQQKLRMAQYGIDDQHEDLINDVLKLEAELANYVAITGPVANFSDDAPLQRILSPFLDGRASEDGVKDSVMWFKLRFKPIFLGYYRVLQQMNINTLNDFDKLKNNQVSVMIKQVGDSVALSNPHPYNVTLWINQDVYALSKADTLAQVHRYLDEIKSEYDKVGATDKARIAEDLNIDTVQSDIKKNENMGMMDTMWAKMTGTYNDQEDQTKLNSMFKQPEVVKGIDISDMLPGDAPVELVTAYRLAAYGNSENMPWRVEAVLKLERWMERHMAYSGKSATFTGTVEEFWNTFRMSFRITSERGQEHCIRWFEYRFLPVYTAWYEVCKHQRGAEPSKVWKTLSATAKFRFATRVSELRVLLDERLRFVFDVTEAPFEGEESERMTTRAKRLLQSLEMKANEARLKDPEMETRKTMQARQGVSSVYSRSDATTGLRNSDLDQGLAPAYTHSPNPGLSDRQYKAGKFEQAKQFEQVKVDTERDFSADTTPKGSNMDPGSDKGVSLNKDEITKVLIQQMVKEGFTDPRQIAQMLALTDYETGGFKHTAENMNYRDAGRARSIFRKLKRFSIPQVHEIIKQGPVAFANAVYNGWLGNDDSPNDGWLYRGRGLVQLTGKDNYERASEDLGVDIVNNPRKVSEDPETMAKTAIWFFKNSPQMQSIKEHGDFSYAARGLNGGKALPGMDKRERLYNSYLDDLVSGRLTKDMQKEEVEEEATSADQPLSPEPSLALKNASNEKLNNNFASEGRNDRVSKSTRDKIEAKRRRHEIAMNRPKPSSTPTLDDSQAQASAAVKVNKTMDAKETASIINPPAPKPAPTPTPVQQAPTLTPTPAPLPTPAPSEPVKVDVAMKPETEAALAGNTAILQGILEELRAGNQLSAKQRQEVVFMN